MAKLILTPAIILAIAFQTVSGQVNYSCNCKDKINSGPYLSGELFIPAEPLDVETYFNRDWLLGDIYLANGEIVRNKYIKYNKLLDEVFWLEPVSNSIIKLDKEGILQFHFLNFQGDTSVYFKRITVKRSAFADSSEIFGQEIFNGKLSLFILHNFFIKQREIVVIKGIMFQKNIYGEESIYYFRFLNNKTVGLKNINRKNMYAFAPDKKDLIKQVFKLTRLSKIEAYPDIIIFMRFLNSIVNQ